jgi:hypothetical protein
MTITIAIIVTITDTIINTKILNKNLDILSVEVFI